jgi:hypothetical protein
MRHYRHAQAAVKRGVAIIVLMKLVGRRLLGSASAIDDQGRLARVSSALQPGGFAERGVYRFHSFEEAERWLTQMMVRRSLARRNLKTSPASAGR